VVVFDSSSVSKDDGIFIGKDFISTNTIGVSSVSINGKLSIEDIFSLSSLSLFVDTSEGKLFVSVTIKDDHDLEMVLGDLLELSTENTTEVATKDDDIILFKILGSGLALLKETSESTSGLGD